MTADWYVRLVGFELRDLPWRTKRDLLAEIREHLAELPERTDLVERLGPPEQYAAELRSAAGLERRRGPIALLRARRPLSVTLTVAALVLIGLAIGAVEWVDGYQPIATGNTGYGPLGGHDSPAGDGQYVVFRQGKRFRFGMTIWNSGRYTVRVLGVGGVGIPVSYRLLISRPTEWKYGGMPGPFTPFRPFDLRPGEQRGLMFTGVYHEPCPARGGVIGWSGVPVRFRFLWRTTTVAVALPESLAFDFPKSSACPKPTR